MTQHRGDPAKQIRNRFIFAQPKEGWRDGSAIREGIARWKQFREDAPELLQAITEAVSAGTLTEDDEMDAFLADAVKMVAARKPGSAAFGNLAARLETPGTPRPASYTAAAAGAAPMTRMEDMSSQELQAATLDAFGGLARVRKT